MTDHGRRLAKPKLIVALDVAATAEALDICRSLLPEVDFFKVGLSLFCAEGPSVIRAIKDIGALVFLDLKLHDIPNRVHQTAGVIGAYGVDMVTIHCLGGSAMLAAAKNGVAEGANRAAVPPPLVIGVTILSSLDESDLEGMGVNNQIGREVGILAGLAKDAGLDGVVASPRELKTIRSEFTTGEFVIVTSGIRPAWAPGTPDRKRVLTPAQAVAAGASYLVVGRPITGAEDPRSAASGILREMEQGHDV